MSIADDDAMNGSSYPRAGGRSRRRSFTPAEKLEHLAGYETACERSEGGAYLRRSGLYSSLISEWRRLARHPARVLPELVATGPSQVYTWDITKLPGPTKGVYYDAYVMIDIYSRYLVGAHEPGVPPRS